MNDFYGKFPIILSEALYQEKVTFPEKLQIQYTPKKVYRGIRFKEPDKIKVEKSDFLSQAERQLPGTDMTDIENYSCSCFVDKQELIAAFKLPRKNKGIAVGTMKDVYGPCIEDIDTSHIHWFLYDNMDPSCEFEVL